MASRHVARQRFSVNGHSFLPVDGQCSGPLVATRTSHWWPVGLPAWAVLVLVTVVGLVQWHDSLSVQGLGEADGVAGGLADVGVVQEPVHGGGGQGLGHE